MKVIKDFENYSICPKGQVTNTSTGRVLSASCNSQNGYPQVTLYKRNRGTKFYIHRLIALSFIPNPDNLPEVNHIDSNRTNNSIDNLEWVSSSGNSNHAVTKGQRDHLARMTKQDIAKAFSYVISGKSYKEVSELFSNSWKPGFLSVKVKQYAQTINKEQQLLDELKRQRIVRSLKNLESINNV